MSRRILPRATESALDDDNLLAEFLLRLPPLPSSLPRASLVCKRWRRLVSEPHFLRRFRSHHRKAPLLGFIYHDVLSYSIGFISVLDSPNRIPTPKFSLQLDQFGRILDSHHGLVLILNLSKKHVDVWDPVIQDHRYVALPQGFLYKDIMGGLVLCAVEDQGHVHGACHSYPFKIVLVRLNSRNELCFSVYSSGTGVWGNTISSGVLSWDILSFTTHFFLIGNSVCWLLATERIKILQFDLNEQNLAFIDVPSDAYDIDAYMCNRHELTIMPTDSGVINLIFLEGYTATVRVWKRMSIGTADASWILGSTLELSKVLSLRPSGDETSVVMLASDEDGNMMFKLADGSVVMVHIGTKQFKKLTEKIDNSDRYWCYPFTSFYTCPGI